MKNSFHNNLFERSMFGARKPLAANQHVKRKRDNMAETMPKTNPHVLGRCLHSALRFLAAQKVAEGSVTRTNEEHIAAKAARRIIAAMFLDSEESSSLVQGNETASP